MHVDWIYEKDENVINGTSISKVAYYKADCENFFYALARLRTVDGKEAKDRRE